MKTTSTSTRDMAMDVIRQRVLLLDEVWAFALADPPPMGNKRELGWEAATTELLRILRGEPS